MAENLISAELAENIESVVDGWYSETRIDWDDFLDRVETYAGVDLGDSMDSPLIRAIKKHARAYKKL